jgi:hypothetical protein
MAMDQVKNRIALPAARLAEAKRRRDGDIATRGQTFSFKEW